MTRSDGIPIDVKLQVKSSFVITFKPSDVEIRQRPSLHMRSLPSRFTGHNLENKNACWNA